MSFRCVPSFMQNNQRVYEASPLRFGTEKEAWDFGERIFYPPKTVLACYVEEVDDLPNYCYKKGRLTRLNQQ